MLFERVYTVTDYWDGPRAGIADFKGEPHTYESLFDESAGAWADIFLLRAVDAATLRLALEAWSVWLRWEAAFHRGETTLETHPALPADRERHEALEAEIASSLRARGGAPLRARALFKKDETVGELRVAWTLVH